MTFSQHKLRLFGTLTAAALGIVTLTAALALPHPQFGRATTDTGEPGQAPENLGLVCFGYVDMERGVASIYPQVTGQVTRVEVRENDRVRAGQLLAQLDDRTVNLRLRQAEADLKAARRRHQEAEKLPQQHRMKLHQQQAAVAAVRHRLERARLVLTRQKELAGMKLVNDKEAMVAETSVHELEAVERAEQARLGELQLTDPAIEAERAADEVGAKQAQLELARRAVEDCQVRAPEGGTVLRVLVSPGDLVGPFIKEPSILLCPEGEQIVLAEVEQEFAGRVAEGQPALLEDDVSDGRVWRGKVRHVSGWVTQRRSIIQEPKQFNDVRTLECVIALEPGQPSLRIGQRLRVRIGWQTSWAASASSG